MSSFNPRQRLAAVMGKCFPTATPATRDALRHAVLSKKLGREIKSSADVTDAEVNELLQKWEHWQSPFLPSDTARKEIVELAHDYQTEQGQQEFVM